MTRSLASLTGGTVVEAPRALRPGCDDAGAHGRSEHLRATTPRRSGRSSRPTASGSTPVISTASPRSSATRPGARGPAPLTGVAAIRAVYDDVILYDGVPSTRHVMGDVVVAVDGVRATSRCSFTVFQARPDFPLQAVLVGRYHDAFACVDGAWEFRARIVHADLLGDLSHHMRSAPEVSAPRERCSRGARRACGAVVPGSAVARDRRGPSRRGPSRRGRSRRPSPRPGAAVRAGVAAVVVTDVVGRGVVDAVVVADVVGGGVVDAVVVADVVGGGVVDADRRSTSWVAGSAVAGAGVVGALVGTVGRPRWSTSTSCPRGARDPRRGCGHAWLDASPSRAAAAPRRRGRGRRRWRSRSRTWGGVGAWSASSGVRDGSGRTRRSRPEVWSGHLAAAAPRRNRTAAGSGARCRRSTPCGTGPPPRPVPTPARRR